MRNQTTENTATTNASSNTNITQTNISATMTPINRIIYNTCAEARRNAIDVMKSEDDKKETQRYFDSIIVKESNNAIAAINHLFEQTDKLPDLELLIAIGRQNLVVLQRRARHAFKDAQKQAEKLQCAYDTTVDCNETPYESQQCETWGTLSDDIDKDGFPTPLSVPRPTICLYCPVYQELTKRYGQVLSEQVKQTMRHMVMAKKEPSTKQPRKTVTELYNSVTPPEQPCCITNQSAEGARQLMQLDKNIGDEIDRLGKAKHWYLKLIRLITLAKHDPRTLDLPVFPEWRPKDYLQDNNLVLVYSPRHDVDQNKEKKATPSIADFHPCIITGNDLAEGYGTNDAHYVDRYGNPIKTGALYENLEAAHDASKVVMTLHGISQYQTTIIKLEDFDALCANPEYARIWAYSDHHIGTASDSEWIEPMLAALQNSPEA